MGVKTVKTDENDPIDDQIIRELVRDGRLSLTDLGRRVGLSPHATGQRLRRLLEAGAIRGFTAIVDPGVAGRAYEALIDVRLLPQTPPDRFEAFVADLDGVEDAWFVTGRYDFVLRARCADAEQLDRIVRAIRQSGGVAATETRIVMRARTRT